MSLGVFGTILATFAVFGVLAFLVCCCLSVAAGYLASNGVKR